MNCRIRSLVKLCFTRLDCILPRCRKPVSEFLDAIRALQPGDISKLVSKLLKKPVTYGAIGNVGDMPRYEEVASRFK